MCRLENDWFNTEGGNTPAHPRRENTRKWSVKAANTAVSVCFKDGDRDRPWQSWREQKRNSSGVVLSLHVDEVGVDGRVKHTQEIAVPVPCLTKRQRLVFNVLSFHHVQQVTYIQSLRYVTYKTRFNPKPWYFPNHKKSSFCTAFKLQ